MAIEFHLDDVMSVLAFLMVISSSAHDKQKKQRSTRGRVG